jgi:hypothetical protein
MQHFPFEADTPFLQDALAQVLRQSAKVSALRGKHI